MSKMQIDNSPHYLLASTCNSAICAHPACWRANRIRMREFNKMIVMQLRNQKQNVIIKEDLIKQAHNEEAFDEDLFEENFPTVSMVNMLDSFNITQSNFSDAQTASSTKIRTKRSKSVLVGKLNLQNLATHSSDLMTLAPANTPLHSVHGFAENREAHDVDNISDTSKSIYQGAREKYFANKKNKSQMPQFHLYNLELPKQKNTKTKMLMWQPRGKPTTKKTESTKKQFQSTRVTLEINQIDSVEAKSTHAMKPGKPKTSPRLNRKLPREDKHYTTPRDSSDQGTQTMEAMATAEEIAVLRSVPMDVLVTVLKQAENRGVLQPKHTQILLNQVRADQESRGDHSLPTIHDNVEMPSSLETKNIKILESPKARSPRIDTKPTYVLDEYQAQYKGPSTAPASSTTHFQMQTDLKAPMTAAELTEDGKQRSKRIKDKPVKQIATIFADEREKNVRPFQYSRNPRDISLGPMPTPSTSPDETEYDSSYNAEIGGSTVLVNPPSHIPSSIVDEQRSTPKMISWDIRSKTDKTSVISGQISPRDSNIDGWPQVREDDYLVASSTNPLEESVALSFLEEELSVRSESKPLNEEVQIQEQFTTLRSNETHSPAPPPPSPEIPSSHATESTPASRGVSKLAIESGKKSSVSSHLEQANDNDTPENDTDNKTPQQEPNK